MQRILFLFTCFSVFLVVRTQAQAQPGSLRITGPAGKPVLVTTAELRALPRVEHRAKDHDGQEHTYAGVSLARLLERAGAPLGAGLRGKALAQYLLVRAADGYAVVFALPELDSAFTKQVIFLADQRDGQPLPAQQGPYRLVVPQESKQARWVRQVTDLMVLTANE